MQSVDMPPFGSGGAGQDLDEAALKACVQTLDGTGTKLGLTLTSQWAARLIRNMFASPAPGHSGAVSVFADLLQSAEDEEAQFVAVGVADIGAVEPFGHPLPGLALVRRAERNRPFVHGVDRGFGLG